MDECHESCRLKLEAAELGGDRAARPPRREAVGDHAHLRMHEGLQAGARYAALQ